MIPPTSYSSFLLRLQWMQNNGSPTWVASLQSTQSGEVRCFSRMEALTQFLLAEFGENPPPEEAEPPAANSTENQMVRPAL